MRLILVRLELFLFLQTRKNKKADSLKPVKNACKKFFSDQKRILPHPQAFGDMVF
jgi:hypothetical protein